jgi:acyl-CoA synthetase (AMP-forming)/AMP-acid ligase II
VTGVTDTTADVAGVFELLEQRLVEYEARPLFRFLSAAGTEASVLTYADTARRAQSIAAGLEANRNSPVLLVFAPGPDFVCAFLGCLAAGAIAVPVFPPDPARLEDALPRLRSIVRSAQPEVVLSDSVLAAFADPIKAEVPELRDVPWIESDRIDAARGPSEKPQRRRPSLALLQYTSGSTSSPRGVMVAHRNLLANLRQMGAWLGLRDDMRLDFGERFRAVCWLPFYHDMGLISGILLTIYSAGETSFISPADFVRRPLVWMEAISRYQANFAGGPDFAYALCVRRSNAKQREQLDLSSWRVAFSGAEPVRAKTLSSFASAFACAGFRAESFAPCYGLAEATLLVTMAPRAAGATVAELDAAALEDGDAIAAGEYSARRTSIVSCGAPVAGVEVRIVDPDDERPVDDGRIGEVWVRGPNVASGYWRSQDATTSCFERELPGGGAGFLRTGDLGFVRGGELFVTSRQKDLIIVRGRNHSPSDIEQAVEYSHDAIRPGSCAAFSVEGDDGEQLVLVAEVDDAGDERHRSAVFRAASNAVFNRHGLALEKLVLIARRTIPRTSSGKIQRHAVRASYLEDRLDTVASLNRRSAVPPPDRSTAR